MKTQILYILITFLLISCENDSGSMVIVLEPDKHLEDTQAGSFLKQLEIDYANGLDLFTNIHKKLEEKATLKDFYLENKNKIVMIWRINSTVIFEEEEQLSGGLSKTLIMHFDKEGIEWSELLGEEKAHELKPDRKYRCGIVISSEKDYCRLALCGYGKYCKSVMLIEAN